MKQRLRKRQLYARYADDAHYGNSAQCRIQQWEAEMHAWNNMVPTGREFGSPDYERLEILDAYIAGHISEQEAMQQLEIDREALAAMVATDGIPNRARDGDGDGDGGNRDGVPWPAN